MRAAAGQTADSLDEGVAQVETVLAPYRAAGVVDLVQSLSGRGGANTAFIIVKLAPWEERATAQAEVMRDLSARLSGIPGLNARVIGGNSLGIRGASGSGSLDVAVASTDRAALPGAAEALLAAMFDDPAFTAPQLASDAWEPMLEVSLDHEALRDLGLDEVPALRLDMLRLAQAEALLRGGQTTAAAQALGATAASAPELRDRMEMLRARLSSAQGDGAGVIATRMETPSEGYRRLRAAALFDRGDWEAARDGYAALWRDPETPLGAGEAIRLLLAAHRSGDTALVAELLDGLPQLARSPELAEVARSLAPVAPLALPIGQKSATDRMQDADAALQRLERVAGDG